MPDYPVPPDPDETALSDDVAGRRSSPRPSQPDRPAASKSGVVSWRTLPDEDAKAVWERLREWVEWFTIRYRISESLVPNCWYRHGNLVEELFALHISHKVAYDPADTGFGPIGWHERLSLAIPRLRNAYTGECSRGHDPHRPRSWQTPVEEWDAWTARSHAQFGTHPGAGTERKSTP